MNEKIGDIRKKKSSFVRFHLGFWFQCFGVAHTVAVSVGNAIIFLNQKSGPRLKMNVASVITATR